MGKAPECQGDREHTRGLPKFFLGAPGLEGQSLNICDKFMMLR